MAGIKSIRKLLSRGRATCRIKCPCNCSPSNDQGSSNLAWNLTTCTCIDIHSELPKLYIHIKLHENEQDSYIYNYKIYTRYATMIMQELIKEVRSYIIKIIIITFFQFAIKELEN